jgi:hypothetical protein
MGCFFHLLTSFRSSRILKSSLFSTETMFKSDKVVHAYNHSPWEAEAGEFWSLDYIPKPSLKGNKDRKKKKRNDV